MKKISISKPIIFILTIFLLASCAPSPQPEVTPPSPYIWEGEVVISSEDWMEKKTAISRLPDECTPRYAELWNGNFVDAIDHTGTIHTISSREKFDIEIAGVRKGFVTRIIDGQRHTRHQNDATFVNEGAENDYYQAAYVRADNLSFMEITIDWGSSETPNSAQGTIYVTCQQYYKSN